MKRRSSASKAFPTHGSELRALLKACHAQPDDDTPRLVLADWLQERDDPRGELMRLQCQLAAMPAADPQYDELCSRQEEWWKCFGQLWEKEASNRIWEPGAHDRGLPTFGHYIGDPNWFAVDDFDDPKKDRAAAAIATGWPAMVWVILCPDEFDSEGEDEDPLAAFTRPPWTDSPTPVGIGFTEWADVSGKLLDRIAQIPNLRGLSFFETQATPRVLPHVAAMTQLEYLDLWELRLTDDGLKSLAQLTRLRTFISGYDRAGGITSAGIKTLAKFTELRELELSSKQITAAGFKTIGQLSKLEVLEVSGATDAALQHLRGLTRLRKLNLTGDAVRGAGLEHFPLLTELELSTTRVDDAGLVHVAGLRRLRRLSLDETRVTGAGLKHLTGLQWLESFSLTDTRVSDEHLVSLEGFARLQELSLYGTEVTQAGAKRLQKKLPRLVDDILV